MINSLDKLSNLKYVDYQNYMIGMAIKDILIYKNQQTKIPEKYDFISKKFYGYPYSKSGSKSYNSKISMFGKSFFATINLRKTTYHQESLIDTNTAFIELYLKIAFDIMKISFLIEENKSLILDFLKDSFNTEDLEQFFKKISYIEIYEEMQDNKTILEAIKQVSQ